MASKVEIKIIHAIAQARGAPVSTGDIGRATNGGPQYAMTYLRKMEDAGKVHRHQSAPYKHCAWTLK